MTPHADARAAGRGFPVTSATPLNTFEHEIQALNDEIRKIQLGCQEIIETHRAGQDGLRHDSSRASPSRVVPRMGTRLDYSKQLQHDAVWIPRHAPATNADVTIPDNCRIILPLTENERRTNDKPDKPSPREAQQATTDQPQPGDANCADSGANCNTAPLPSELTQTKPAARLADAVAESDVRSEVIADGDVECSVSKSLSSSSVHQITQTPDAASADTLHDLYSQYVDVMYTNQENLQHTMLLQQKLFQQKLLLQQQQTADAEGNQSADQTSLAAGCQCSHGAKQGTAHAKCQHNSAQCSAMPAPAALPRLAHGESSGTNSSQVQMEWVVKRRADGSRYITRRPMRSKMLKERARKISEERCGMTTDDDAMSELKVGRYWSKDERKRHLEKAREYKRRKQQMLQLKMDTVREHDELRREPNILELSQRKQLRHKARKAFDDFMTVQELLAHGSGRHAAPSESNQSSTTAGNSTLLSVTTV